METTRKAIPRTLKETAVIKPAMEFNVLWNKYMDENPELAFKKNKKYMMFIKTIAKHNYMQKGIEDIYVSHNAAVDFFTE